MTTQADPTIPLSDATASVPPEAVTAWVERYLQAWRSNSVEDIAALFTEDAQYHESPYSTEWIGRDEIVAGWRGRWAWQAGGWDFEWSVASINGMTAVITGIGHYVELGDFDNSWTISFTDSGRSDHFEMVNTERA